MNELIEIVKNVGLVFSVLASGYGLYRILLDRPKIKIDLISTQQVEGYLELRLSFINRGRLMSSAFKFLLISNGKNYLGLQKRVRKIYPKGNHSIISPPVKYVDAYPLELPAGKACHFDLYFKVADVKNKKLEISLVNHKKIKLSI